MRSGCTRNSNLVVRIAPTSRQPPPPPPPRFIYLESLSWVVTSRQGWRDVTPRLTAVGVSEVLPELEIGNYEFRAQLERAKSGRLTAT